MQGRASLVIAVLNIYKHFCYSPSSEVLFIIDNRIYHFSVTVLDFYKENGIELLSFPSHRGTANHLHQLDVLVYGLLDIFIIIQKVDGWTRTLVPLYLTIMYRYQ